MGTTIKNTANFVCTIAATKFWPSLSYQLKKNDVVHALLSLTHYD
jgi:hypothetical protein